MAYIKTFFNKPLFIKTPISYRRPGSRWAGCKDNIQRMGMKLLLYMNRNNVRIVDATYRQDEDNSWPVRVYMPEKQGKFPALLDVHGGAWTSGGCSDNEKIDLSLAASGMVVFAIECRKAPTYTYPAQVVDIKLRHTLNWFRFDLVTSRSRCLFTIAVLKHWNKWPFFKAPKKPTVYHMDRGIDIRSFYQKKKEK
jgi:hypothetical protein